MTIEDIVLERKIQEIVHFTTNRGALGILATRTLKARQLLNDDEQLKHIFYPNAAARPRDQNWHSYVNLSISRINTKFFAVASDAWHKEKEFWWCIFSFAPEVMSHTGVYFTTTNNMYSDVERATGAVGLEKLFAQTIVQWRGTTVTRQKNCSDSLPTCFQAEVLYPEQLSTGFLRRIYVQNDLCADELAGQMAAVGHAPVPIEIAPHLFVEIK